MLTKDDSILTVAKANGSTLIHQLVQITGLTMTTVPPSTIGA